MTVVQHNSVYLNYVKRFAHYRETILLRIYILTRNYGKVHKKSTLHAICMHFVVTYNETRNLETKNNNKYSVRTI